MSGTKNLKFFIVDDDPFSRMLYQQHLLNLGYRNNILFDNGEDCINRLNLQPDIIFLDYDMKPANGLDVIERVKKLNPNVYLLMISGQKDIQVAMEAVGSGAYDYIVKGEQDLEMISNVINKIISAKITAEKQELAA